MAPREDAVLAWRTIESLDPNQGGALNGLLYPGTALVAITMSMSMLEARFRIERTPSEFSAESITNITRRDPGASHGDLKDCR